MLLTMDHYYKTLWVFIMKYVTSIYEYTALTYIFCQLLFKKYLTLTKIGTLYSVTCQMTHTPEHLKATGILTNI